MALLEADHDHRHECSPRSRRQPADLVGPCPALIVVRSRHASPTSVGLGRRRLLNQGRTGATRADRTEAHSAEREVRPIERMTGIRSAGGPSAAPDW